MDLGECLSDDVAVWCCCCGLGVELGCGTWSFGRETWNNDVWDGGCGVVWLAGDGGGADGGDGGDAMLLAA
jgi:hypothetical protein